MLLTLAALLVFLTGLAHSWLGERYLLRRLFKRENLPALLGSTAFTTGTLRFVWHLLTLVWWGLAVLLILAARGPLETRLMLQIFSGIAALSALFPLYFTRGRHLSWLVFSAIALLLWLEANGR
ncbi:hypothetical protein H5407_19110 [Mitsuaria sp. WAJ17]|uniref:hypothetical protein n=1 Tax=Mitsuaria sp. WAJ17 TaxID=2761452 RepID=UPI0016011632|nr:hypothetical protein [Mitsuaria sp. WAJ17]MBB2487350.1 hypothetical protein [Mitsuaria sp. WAJ17]